MPADDTRTPAHSAFRPLETNRQFSSAVAAVALAAAVGLHLRFVLSAGALWRDEANTVAVASASSWAGLWRLIEFDSYPALWPALLRLWMAVAGDSDTALRVAGLAGGLAIPLSIWLAARVIGRPAPALAIALVAVNPVILVWGSSVRAWGLGTGLIILAAALIWRAAVTRSARSFAAAALIATLSVQCLYHNAIPLAAIGAAIAAAGLRARKPSLMLAPLGVGAIAAASLLPYVPTLSRTGDWAMLNVVDIGGLNVFARFLMALGPMPPFVLALWLGTLGATAAGVVLSRRRNANDRKDAPFTTFVLTAIVATPALMLPFYALFDYPANPWYFIGLAGLLAFLTDAAVSTSALPALRALRPLLAVAVLLIGILPAWRSTAQPLSNADVVARFLAAESSPGDVIIASPWLYGISLRRYLEPDTALSSVPPLDDISVHRFDLLKIRMVSEESLSPLLDEVRLALESGRRVWIVGDLPPAGFAEARPGRPPLAETGWRTLPYIEAWTDELMSFLEAHALEREEVPVERRAQPLENARLAWFSGWR